MNENRKEFLTKDAELKYLRNKISYLELENENLKLKLKLAEAENPRPAEKKKQKCILRDPFFGDLCEFYTNVPDPVNVSYPAPGFSSTFIKLK